MQIRYIAIIIFAVAATASSFTCSSQGFSDKQVKIVTAEVGGGIDFAARIVADGLSTAWKQQVIVDNRGGNGIIAAQAIVKEPPDGHTLLFYGNNIWLLQFMQDDVPFDQARDFAPITFAVSSPSILVVHPSLPVKSVKDLIALAKRRPGELNYASASTGSATHLGSELFKMMSGTNIVRVPYKGTGPGLSALLGGDQVHMMIAVVASAMPHIQSKRLHALAITSARPSELVPNLPTVSASGLPGYELVAVWGIYAAAKTSPALVDQLNSDIVKVLKQPDIKQKFLNSGVETVASTPSQFASVLKTETAKWGSLIKAAGIRTE